MATHTVYFELPTRPMSSGDAIFTIQRNKAILGKIKISRGGIDYFPANRKKAIKIRWVQFDKMVKEWNWE